jgi:acetyltransferase-like isoleucine patch superfamily enzyme/lysophospholipase L1-like esterase
LRQRFGNQISIDDDCDLAPDLTVYVSDGGFLHLGKRVSIMRGTTIQVLEGARIFIDDDVKIGENVFIAAMVGILIGKGSGISNMVDIHDHNHRDRSLIYLPNGELTCDASGFEAAPIIIESGVIISNKVSITAGVRIGQNTKVGANSVVSRTLENNVVAVGSPSRNIRDFDGILNQQNVEPYLRVGFFGTSIMQHFEAYAPSIYEQMNLPQVGSQVVIEKWVNRGYAHQVYLGLQVAWPNINVEIENHGKGGATSRDILEYTKKFFENYDKRFDITFLGCGINDVWRHFQGRGDESVSIDEFEANYKEILEFLIKNSTYVICISETPFNLQDAEQMNIKLKKFNKVAQNCALALSSEYLDVWTIFTKVSRNIKSKRKKGEVDISLWSDGVHLSEFGDTLLAKLILDYLADAKLVENSQTLPRLERWTALKRYTKVINFDQPEQL